LLAALLVSSTVHPWYLLWPLALLPLRFSPATWVWSLTVPLSYVALVNPEGYHVPAWGLAAEYGPVALALVGTALVCWKPWGKRNRDAGMKGRRDEGARPAPPVD
jgi:hypothetical protein